MLLLPTCCCCCCWPSSFEPQESVNGVYLFSSSCVSPSSEPGPIAPVRAAAGVADAESAVVARGRASAQLAPVTNDAAESAQNEQTTPTTKSTDGPFAAGGAGRSAAAAASSAP